MSNKNFTVSVTKNWMILFSTLYAIIVYCVVKQPQYQVTLIEMHKKNTVTLLPLHVPQYFSIKNYFVCANKQSKLTIPWPIPQHYTH